MSQFDQNNFIARMIPTATFRGVEVAIRKMGLYLENIQCVNVVLFGGAALCIEGVKNDFNDLDMLLDIEYKGDSEEDLERIKKDKEIISDHFVKDQEVINGLFANEWVGMANIDYDVTDDDKLFNISDMAPHFPVVMSNIVREEQSKLLTANREGELIEMGEFTMCLRTLSLESIFISKVLAGRDKDVENLKLIARSGKITPESLLQEIDKLSQFNSAESIHEALQLMASSVIESFDLIKDQRKAMQYYEMFEAKIEHYAHVLHGDVAEYYSESGLFPDDEDYELTSDNMSFYTKNYNGEEYDDDGYNF